MKNVNRDGFFSLKKKLNDTFLFEVAYFLKNNSFKQNIRFKYILLKRYSSIAFSNLSKSILIFYLFSG